MKQIKGTWCKWYQKWFVQPSNPSEVIEEVYVRITVVRMHTGKNVEPYLYLPEITVLKILYTVLRMASNRFQLQSNRFQSILVLGFILNKMFRGQIQEILHIESCHKTWICTDFFCNVKFCIVVNNLKHTINYYLRRWVC